MTLRLRVVGLVTDAVTVIDVKTAPQTVRVLVAVPSTVDVVALPGASEEPAHALSLVKVTVLPGL